MHTALPAKIALHANTATAVDHAGFVQKESPGNQLFLQEVQKSLPDPIPVNAGQRRKREPDAQEQAGREVIAGSMEGEGKFI